MRQPGSGDMEVVVGPASSFTDGARSLIRAGQRNIAVYSHKGKFYAIDNACYHHGGPLHNGDIEDLGGHPCVICPWHSYRISLETGEGLYVGLDLAAKKECVKSKGIKQRIHPVIVRDGNVIVQVTTGGPSIESDTYATMAIANQEQPSGKPSTAVNNLRHIHSKGAGTFSDPDEAEREKLRAQLRSKNLSAAVNTLRTSDVPHVQCISRRVVSADRSVVQFVFDKVSGFEPKESLRPGMWVTLELPFTFKDAQERLAAKSMGSSSTMVVGGRKASGNAFTVQSAASIASPQAATAREDAPMPDTPLKRTYTVIGATSQNSRNRHGQGWFSVAVKDMTSPGVPRAVRNALHAGGCGSRWMHRKGHKGDVTGVGPILSPDMRVVESGGRFSLAMERTLISRRQGKVLILTGGIGVTPAIASINEMLQDDFGRSSGPSLHMLHIHTDSTLSAVPFLPELLMYSREMKGTRVDADPMSYRLSLYATRQYSLDDSKGELTYSNGLSSIAYVDSEDDNPLPSPPELPTSPTRLTRGQPVEDPLARGFGHKTLSLLRNDAAQMDASLGELQKDGGLFFGRRPTRTDVVESCKAVFGTATDFTVFLCGPEAMIVEWSRVLEDVGVSAQNILTERFDF